jgi:hypothetical protein
VIRRIKTLSDSRRIVPRRGYLLNVAAVSFPAKCRSRRPSPVAHIGCEQVNVGKVCGLPTAASKSSSEYFGAKTSSSVWPRWSIVFVIAFIPHAIGTIDLDYTPNADPSLSLGQCSAIVQNTEVYGERGARLGKNGVKKSRFYED